MLSPTSCLAITGTVLCIKRFPGEEFAAVLHKTGAVISFRRTKITPLQSGANDVKETNGVGGEKMADDIFDIMEGTTLVFDHVGKWDANSSTFHNASVSIIGKQLGGSKRSHEGEDGGDQAKSTTLVPSRRQRKTMQL